MPATLLTFFVVCFETLWLLWLPGVLLKYALRLPRQSDWLLQIASEIGLGIAFWPLIFLWNSTLVRYGLSRPWSPPVAQLCTIGLGVAGLVILIVRTRMNWPAQVQSLRRQRIWLLLFAALLLLTGWTRWQHIRALVLPNWVDSVHHTMIVRLLVEQGQLPVSYRPFLPDSVFAYHWGYHALVAWLCWLHGTTDSFTIAELILLFGQILNSLVLLMLYAGGRQLFQSRRAGFFAAVLGALVSWFPAYYVSWGRYPQLAGLLLFAPAMIALWKLHTRSKLHVGWGVAAAMLVASTFLIHVRVAFFMLTFISVVAIWLASQRAWSTLARWTLTGVLSIGITLPWLLTLLHLPKPPLFLSTPLPAQQAWWSNYNAITWSLVWVPGVHEMMAVATGGVSGWLGWGQPTVQQRLFAAIWSVALLGGIIWQSQKAKRADARLTLALLIKRLRAPWLQLCLLVFWCAFTFLLLNLRVLHLPDLTFVTNNAAVITLFVPLSLAAGGLLAWFSGCIIPQRWLKLATVIMLIIIGLWGADHMRTIVNAETILVTPADVRALRWIRTNLPKHATFAVNTWRWSGNTYAGMDGGYWISVLTDRAALVPPALYPTVTTPAITMQINDLLETWSNADSLEDPALRSLLKQAGVTHLYIGERGGHLQVAKLLDQPYVRLVYQDGAVYIFELSES